jgi:hypothetical protein
MKNNTSHPAYRVLGSALLSGLMVAAGLAQSPKPPASTPAPAQSAPAAGGEAAIPADTVVMKVGTRQFTKADIDMVISTLPPQVQTALASRGKKDLGDQYALLQALSQQAEAQHLDQSPQFKQKLAFQKAQLEAQEAFEALNSRADVTPEEIQQYYNAHLDDYDEITVRQIIVRKKAAEPGSDPAHAAAAASSGPGLSVADAKTRAEAIRKELLAGTDIKKITDEFKSPGDVIIDAEPRTIRHGGMRQDMEKVAFGLKEGEVSEPVDVPQALVLFQVIKHSHSDLKSVTPEIEKKLKQEKVQASIDSVKNNANIWMDEAYFGGSAKPSLGATPVTPGASHSQK